MLNIKKYQRASAVEPNEIREIEAVQITPANVDEVIEWAGGAKVIEHDALDHEKTYVGMNLQTDLGVKRVQQYDWVCKDEQGRFYSLSEKTFNLLYNS